MGGCCGSDKANEGDNSMLPGNQIGIKPVHQRYSSYEEQKRHQLNIDLFNKS